MGILDVPGLSPQKARLQSLLTRLAPASTLPVPATAPSVDVPTVTTSSTATISGGQYIGPQTGKVTEVGSRGTWNSTNWRLVVGGKSCLDFYHTGTSLEFQVFPNLTGASPIWIWVNGAPVTAVPDSVTTTASSNIFIKLTFGSSARRRIEFFMPLGGGSWESVATDYASVISPAARKPVVAFVGDSFWGGSPATPTMQCGDFLISRMLGVECFSQSFGGCGWVSAGTATTFGNATRVAAVAAANPELIVFQGSLNDDGQAGIQAAASAAFAAYATALPKAQCIVFGPQPNAATSTLSANRSSNIAAVAAAAAAAPNVLAFHDLVGTAGGVPSSWFANQTNPDGTLLTYLGSVYKISNGGASFSNGPFHPGTAPQYALQTVAYTGTGEAGIGRTVTDGVTNSTTTLTSATANFTSTDVGLVVTGSGIPANTTIASRTNSTTVVLSQAATATASGVTVAVTNQRLDGTRDTYLYSDGTHPMPEASASMAISEAGLIRADLLAAAS